MTLSTGSESVRRNSTSVDSMGADLPQLLSEFFSVSSDQIDLERETAATGSEASITSSRSSIRRQGTAQSAVNARVQLEDDHTLFQSRLGDMRVALIRFLGSSVKSVSIISMTCGQGHYPYSLNETTSEKCTKCAVSTYKEELDDEGFSEGCTPCPSDHMLTPGGSISVSECKCDERNGYTLQLQDGAKWNASVNLSASELDVTASVVKQSNSSRSPQSWQCVRSWQTVTIAEAKSAAQTLSNVVAAVAAANIAVAVASSVGVAVSGTLGGGLVGLEAGVAGAEVGGIAGGGAVGEPDLSVSASGTVILISQVQFLRYTRAHANTLSHTHF